MVACAEAWRGDGAIVASPMGVIPTLGARLAQLTFEPGLLLTDGEATLVYPESADERGVEGWLPYRSSCAAPIITCRRPAATMVNTLR